MSSVMPVSLVGNKFVSEYYNTLIENPENITKYYTNDSVMTRGNACFEDEKLNTLQQSTGSESIKVTLAHTNFKAAKLVLSGVNAQPSFGKGILIVVFGTVALKGNENDSPVRQFVQTFFLAPQSESAQHSYVVQNDTFYFVVPHQQPQQPTPQPQLNNFSPIPTATVSHVVVTNHHEPAPVQQTTEQRAAPVVPNNQQQQQTTQPASTAANTNNTPVAQTANQTTTTPVANTTAPTVAETKTQETKSTANNNNNTAQTNGSAKQNKDRSSSRRANNTGNNNNTTNNNATTTTPANNNTAATSNGVSSSSTSSATNTSSSAPVRRETPRTPSWAGVVTEGKVVVAPDQLAPPQAPLILSKKLSSGEKKSKSNNNNNNKSGNKEKGSDKKGFFKNSDPEKFQGEKEERSIYVSNIPFSSDVNAVKTAFDRFGKIYEVILKENGYAFVNFYNSEAAGKALKEQIVLENRKLIVEPRKATKSRDQ